MNKLTEAQVFSAEKKRYKPNQDPDYFYPTSQPPRSIVSSKITSVFDCTAKAPSSFSDSSKRVISKKTDPDFVYSTSLPTIHTSRAAERVQVQSIENFFEENTEFEYSRGISFSDERTRIRFSEEWGRLSKEKIAEQKRNDPDIFTIWDRYFKEQKSTGKDPATSLITIKQTSDPRIGLGAYAVCDIPKGTPLGQYGCEATMKRKGCPDYVFYLPEESGMSDLWKYDALKKRNHTAFFNHSTNPNVASCGVYRKEAPLIGFFVDRNIRAGDPLTINYGDQYDWQGKKPIEL